jgi:uncharacterized protein
VVSNRRGDDHLGRADHDSAQNPRERGSLRCWGTIFGLGWALTGACPGPLFALVGDGVTVMIVAIVSAMAGTWQYGFLRPKLPH